MPARLVTPLRRLLVLIVSGGVAVSTWKWYLNSSDYSLLEPDFGSRSNHLVDGDFDNYEVPEDLQDHSFSSIAGNKCHTSNPQAVPSLVTMVLSAPSNKERRNAIRESWGPQTNVVFLIGSSSHHQLLQEAEVNHDILFVPGMTNDTYSTITSKTIFGLRWVRAHCARRVKFLLKVDDDSFVNVMRLKTFIADITPDEEIETAMYGMKAFGWAPHRDPSSKYYLPESIYPLPFLPDYLTGPAYLMTTDLIGPILEANTVKSNETSGKMIFPLEDVYVTGILTRQMGFDNLIDRTDLFPNQFVPPSRVCPISGVISIHRIKPKWHKRLHEALQTSLEKCKDLKGFVA